jgi:menaquinone-specific isochorismate synthase
MSKLFHIPLNILEESQKSFEENKEQILLSYVSQITPVTFVSLLHHLTLKNDHVFYFSQQQENKSLLAVDPLLKKTFKKDEINLLKIELDELGKKIISNQNDFPGIDIPSFYTSMKFPLGKDSQEWSDFGEIDLFMPKIALYQNNDSFFLISNFFSEGFSHQEDLYNRIDDQISYISELDTKLKNIETSSLIIKDLNLSGEKNEWIKKINSTAESIKLKVIDKVVIARRVQYEIDSDINWQQKFNELNEKYPQCANFLLKSGSSIFFGSTPEVLAKFSGNNFTTEALAGSMMRGKNKAEDDLLGNELLNSKKNKAEHDAVIKYLSDSLAKYLTDIEIDKSPVAKKLFNIQHLQTNISGILNPGTSMIEIIDSLFPTPAVCGIPKNKSLDLISKLEDFDRGLFSGLIGWFNLNGYGEFYVAIRSGLIKEKRFFAYAGCGIVQGSDAYEEFEETELKLKPILSLFSNED